MSATTTLTTASIAPATAMLSQRPITPKMSPPTLSPLREPITPLPPRPNPSSDPFLTPLASPRPANLASSYGDLFALDPKEAMRLLCAGIEDLVAMTGDVPPTPPSKNPRPPNMRGMQAEKECLVRTWSDKSLKDLSIRGHHRRPSQLKNEHKLDEDELRQLEKKQSPRGGYRQPEDLQQQDQLNQQKQQQQEHQQPDQRHQQQPQHQRHEDQRHHPQQGHQKEQHNQPRQRLSPVNFSFASAPAASIDGVRLRSPTTPLPPPTTYSVIVGSDNQPLAVQHSAITRKFYCKKEPPVTIDCYLDRLHQYCPMSTAVYLATSLYIHRLAVEERAIPVTRRNAHRLLLAGLRVAMKALEDLCYPHSKMAKVGGVSEQELARLEISFCFLVGFELVVRADVLRDHWKALDSGRGTRVGGRAEDLPPLRIKPKQRPRTCSDLGMGRRAT